MEDILVQKIYTKDVIFHFPVRFLFLHFSFKYIIYGMINIPNDYQSIKGQSNAREAHSDLEVGRFIHSSTGGTVVQVSQVRLSGTTLAWALGLTGRLDNIYLEMSFADFSACLRHHKCYTGIPVEMLEIFMKGLGS